MTYISFTLILFLTILSLHLNHLRRRELANARRAALLVEEYSQQIKADKIIIDKDEALARNLFRRINELEARCYRLRRELNNRAGAVASYGMENYRLN